MGERKKLKFNLVDVIFLAVLLAAIVFVAIRVIGQILPTPAYTDDPSASESLPPEPEMYVITFTGSETPDYVIDRVEIGAAVTDDSLTLDLGTVIDFQTGPAQFANTAADGHTVLSDREGYSTLYLMIQVEGIDNGFGITANRQNLGIGHTMVVRVGMAKMYLAICDIQKLSDSPYAGQYAELS